MLSQAAVIKPRPEPPYSLSLCRRRPHSAYPSPSQLGSHVLRAPWRGITPRPRPSCKGSHSNGADTAKPVGERGRETPPLHNARRAHTHRHGGPARQTRTLTGPAPQLTMCTTNNNATHRRHAGPAPHSARTRPRSPPSPPSRLLHSTRHSRPAGPRDEGTKVSASGAGGRGTRSWRHSVHRGPAPRGPRKALTQQSKDSGKRDRGRRSCTLFVARRVAGPGPDPHSRLINARRDAMWAQAFNHTEIAHSATALTTALGPHRTC